MEEGRKPQSLAEVPTYAHPLNPNCKTTLIPVQVYLVILMASSIFFLKREVAHLSPVANESWENLLLHVSGSGLG